jgi:hypothetical protein
VPQTGFLNRRPILQKEEIEEFFSQVKIEQQR